MASQDQDTLGTPSEVAPETNPVIDEGPTESADISDVTQPQTSQSAGEQSATGDDSVPPSATETTPTANNEPTAPQLAPETNSSENIEEAVAPSIPESGSSAVAEQPPIGDALNESQSTPAAKEPREASPREEGQTGTAVSLDTSKAEDSQLSEQTRRLSADKTGLTDGLGQTGTAVSLDTSKAEDSQLSEQTRRLSADKTGSTDGLGQTGTAVSLDTSKAEDSQLSEQTRRLSADKTGLTDGLSINIEDALKTEKPADASSSAPLVGPASSSSKVGNKLGNSRAAGSPMKQGAFRSPRSNPEAVSSSRAMTPMTPKEVPRSPIGGGSIPGSIPSSAARALLPFLIDWLNYNTDYTCKDADLTVETLVEGLKSGLVLCQLIERLLPDLEFSEKPYSGPGLYPKPLARKACIKNLERPLSIAWRRGINATNMCTADDVVDGKIPKIARCLVTLFQSLQMRDIVARGKDTMQGINAVLGRWNWHLSPKTLNDPIGFGSSLAADFADGSRIMILLVYYGLATPQDLLQISAKPQVSERQENFVVVNKLLSSAGCPNLLSPADWVTPPGLCFDVLLFQLDLLWRGNSQDWSGLCNRQPAKSIESLEALVFRDGPAVSPVVEAPANPESPGNAKSADEDDKRAAQSPSPFSPGSPGRSPRTITLWRKGDDLSDLSALHQLRLDLLTHFEDLATAFEAFDSRKLGFLTMSELQWGCRAIAFEGSTKRLFVLLDTRDSGRISRAAFLAMENLPEPIPQRLQSPKQSPLRLEAEGTRDHAMLKQFAEALLQTYGSMEEAFRISDRKAKGYLSHFDLDRTCKVIGFRCDPKLLFSRLDVRKHGHVSRHEILSLKSLIDTVPVMTIPPQPVLWEEGNDLSDLALLQGFANSLYEYFGDLEVAFKSFDVSGAGTLSMTDIRRGVKTSGFEGDAKKLFVLLDSEKEGFVTREAFYSMDRLPDMSGETGPAWLFDTEGQIRIIFDFPNGDNEWPSHTVSEKTAGEGEARFPGSAEESAWLMDEDQRRKVELEDMDLRGVADKNEAAFAAGLVAAEEEIEDYRFSLTDFPASLSKIQGTTSIDGRIELQDGSLRRISVQTAVVDRTGTGSNAADDAALVVEFREFQPDGKLSGDICVQLDVSKIKAVNQMGPAALEEADLDLSFVIVAHPRALLKCGPEANVLSELSSTKTARREPQELYHLSDDGRSFLFHIVVGPSKWKRHEGMCFFDELRILMHFVADGVVSAATSIGKAAGAAVLAASSGN